MSWFCSEHGYRNDIIGFYGCWVFQTMSRLTSKMGQQLFSGRGSTWIHTVKLPSAPKPERPHILFTVGSPWSVLPPGLCPGIFWEQASSPKSNVSQQDTSKLCSSWWPHAWTSSVATDSGADQQARKKCVSSHCIGMLGSETGRQKLLFPMVWDNLTLEQLYRNTSMVLVFS